MTARTRHGQQINCVTAFTRRGACPALSAPMQTGDGLLVRLNPVAGGLSPNALIGLCESAQRHGNGMMEVTARGNLQIRGLTARSAPLLAAEIDALGITVRTGVPVETGPLAGLDPEEIADPSALANRTRDAIETAGLADRLGPKVSVVVDGGGRLTMDTVQADARLVAVETGANMLWRLAIAGDAQSARLIGLFDEDAACDAALAILSAIADIGKEARARDLSPRQIDNFTLQFEGSHPVTHPSVLPDISPTRGEIRPSSSPLPIFAVAEKAKRATLLISPLVGEMSGRTEGGVTERCLKTEPPGILHLTTTHALNLALPFGSMPAEKLIAFAQAAHSLHASEIRFAPQRALLILGLSEAAASSLQTTAASLGFVTDPSDPRQNIAACAGAPACASGHLAAREIAERIAHDAGGVFDPSFALHISGCAKGCARATTATITLVGGENAAGLVVSGTAKSVPVGYIPGDELARGFGRIARSIRNNRRHGESAAACLARLGMDNVAAIFQATHEQDKPPSSKIGLQNKTLERFDDSESNHAAQGQQ